MIRELVQRPTVVKLFPHTSMSWLHLSACSHYPFESAGLPTANPPVDGVFSARCGDEKLSGSASDVADWMETKAAMVDYEPWYGIAIDSHIEPINAELVARGSELRVIRERTTSSWRVFVDATPRISLSRHGGRFWLRVGLEDSRNVDTVEEVVDAILELTS